MWEYYRTKHTSQVNRRRPRKKNEAKDEIRVRAFFRLARTFIISIDRWVRFMTRGSSSPELCYHFTVLPEFYVGYLYVYVYVHGVKCEHVVNLNIATVTRKHQWSFHYLFPSHFQPKFCILTLVYLCNQNLVFFQISGIIKECSLQYLISTS